MENFQYDDPVDSSVSKNQADDTARVRTAALSVDDSIMPQVICVVLDTAVILLMILILNLVTSSHPYSNTTNDTS